MLNQQTGRKVKSLTIPDVGKDVRQQNTQDTVGETIGATLRGKQTSFDPAILRLHTPFRNYCTHTRKHTKTVLAFLNSSKLETTQKYISRIDKLWSIHSPDGISYCKENGNKWIQQC